MANYQLVETHLDLLLQASICMYNAKKEIFSFCYSIGLSYESIHWQFYGFTTSYPCLCKVNCEQIPRIISNTVTWANAACFPWELASQLSNFVYWTNDTSGPKTASYVTKARGKKHTRRNAEQFKIWRNFWNILTVSTEPRSTDYTKWMVK
jgi:hypothetical protein